MKICIAGKNKIAVNAANYLLNDLEINSENILLCPNDTDKGKDTWQPSLRKFGQQRDINIVVLNELYLIQDLIFISLQFDKIIEPDNFSSDKLFNIHFSYLPSYKGMYPSIIPLLQGEMESGVTLHKIDEGIDTGDILKQLKIPIEINDTSRDLYLKYLSYGEELFKKTIKSLLHGDYDSSRQSQLGASYYSKNAIDFNNIVIDLNKTSFEIHNQIRAYIFEEYQLPKINSFKIIKSNLTNEKIERNAFKQKDDQLILSGIDGYKLVLKVED